MSTVIMLALLLLIALVGVTNALGIFFMASTIFRADGSTLITSRLRKSTKYLLVAAGAVNLAVIYTAITLAGDRRVLFGEVANMRAQITQLQDEMKQHKVLVTVPDQSGTMMVDTATAVARLFTEMEHLKRDVAQMQSEIQSLKHEKEGRNNLEDTASATSDKQEQRKSEKIRQPAAVDDIIKSWRQAAKLQHIKLSSPWEKLKKAKNIFSMDFKLI